MNPMKSSSPVGPKSMAMTSGVAILLLLIAISVSAWTVTALSAGTDYREDEAARIARFAVEKNRDLDVFFHDKARKPNSAQSREIDRAINSFAQEDPGVRRAARIDALLRGASAVKSLLAELEKNETTAVNSIIVLADRGEKEALAPIRKALADKRSGEGVRLFAALALGHMGDAESAPALRALLGENRHPDARAAAALSLAKLRAIGAGKDLREVAKRESSTRTRSWAILSLGWHGDPESAALLLDLAKSKTESDRRAAALAIGLLELEAGFETLAKLARDSEDLVRASAASALGRYQGRAEAKALLLTLTKDKSHDVRAAAIRALAAQGEPEAIDVARKWLGDPQEKDPVRRAAAVALGTMGGGGQAGALALTAALADGTDEVRSAAAVALAVTGDAGAASEIENRLAGERKEFVRSDYVLALAALLGKDALPKLEKLPDREGSPAEVLVRGLTPFLGDEAMAKELVSRLLAAAAQREGMGKKADLVAAVNDELLRALALLDKNLEVARAREGQRSQAPPGKPLQDLRVWFEDRPFVVVD